MTPLYSTVPTGTTGATSPDSSTSVPVRWADCGSAELPGWQVGWAHPKFESLLASCSYDHKVIIWKEVAANKWQKYAALYFLYSDE